MELRCDERSRPIKSECAEFFYPFLHPAPQLAKYFVPLITAETVEIETPARFATSRIVTAIKLPLFPSAPTAVPRGKRFVIARPMPARGNLAPCKPQEGARPGAREVARR